MNQSRSLIADGLTVANTYCHFPIIVIGIRQRSLPQTNTFPLFSTTMKLTALLLIPVTTVAFAPVAPVAFPSTRVSNVVLHDIQGDIDDVVRKIEDTTEDVREN